LNENNYDNSNSHIGFFLGSTASSFWSVGCLDASTETFWLVDNYYNTSDTTGVSFTNVLHAAFTHADPESVKFPLSSQ